MTDKRIGCAIPRRAQQQRGGIKLIRPGVWEIRWSHGRDPQTGERLRPTKRIEGTKKDAQRALTAELKRIDEGKPAKKPDLTLGNWLAVYFDVWCADLAPRTLHGYRSGIKTYLPDHLLRKKLRELTRSDVQPLFNQMRARGLSARTIHGTRAVLRRALNVAIDEGYLELNAATKVKLPKPTNSELKVLTLQEIDRFLEAAKGDRWYALWVLLVQTGLRPSEAFALKWSDLEGNRVAITRALVVVPGQPWSLGPTKTRTNRSVSLSHMALRALMDHRAIQRRERLAAGSSYKNHDFIFALSSGGPIDLNNLRKKHFAPLLKRAGLPVIRIYDLRHSAATAQLATGINPKVVSEMLGHATVQMTLNVYAHVTPDMQAETAAMWDRRYG
jgi:integrase